MKAFRVVAKNINLRWVVGGESAAKVRAAIVRQGRDAGFQTTFADVKVYRAELYDQTADLLCYRNGQPLPGCK